MNLIKWRQRCKICNEWFICSHNSRENCFKCTPKLYKDEIKPREYSKDFKEAVKQLLKDISNTKRLYVIKNIIEEFQDEQAETLYNER